MMADSKMLANAKKLRGNQTDAERKLWYWLRNRQIGGLKFRRQVVLGNYVVDFLCHEQKVIIELDGGQHAIQTHYETQRTTYLEKAGYRIVLYWNNDVLLIIHEVLDEISKICGIYYPPSPYPCILLLTPDMVIKC
jgi:very-short-patch-repair endonuclease